MVYDFVANASSASWRISVQAVSQENSHQNGVPRYASGLLQSAALTVEDEWRTAGICVVSSPEMPAVVEGQRVSVHGKMTILDGDRAIVASSIGCLWPESVR